MQSECFSKLVGLRIGVESLSSNVFGAGLETWLEILGGIRN